MTSKRAKVELDRETAAPARLVAEVYDLLLEAGRKQLEALLAVFVKASSKQALEAVRDEAIKRGAFVAVKQSRYQQCNHAQLDSFFSFLEPIDLRTAEVVCRRWRSACSNSHAGWIAELSRQSEVDERWMREITRRHITPSQLTPVSVRVEPSCYRRNESRLLERHSDHLFDFIGRIPSLQRLDCNYAKNVLHRLHNPALRALNCREAPETVVASPLARTLTELDIACSLAEIHLFCSMPQLARLDAFLIKDDAAISPGSHEFAALTHLSLCAPESVAVLEKLFSNIRMPRLQTLSLSETGFDHTDLAAILASSARLTSLDLQDGVWPRETTAELARLTSLRHLSIGHVGSRTLTDVGQITQLRSLDVSLYLERHAELELNACLASLRKLTQLESLRWHQQHNEHLPAGFLSSLPPSLTSLSLSFVASSSCYEFERTDSELAKCLPRLKTLAIELRKRESHYQAIADAQAAPPLTFDDIKRHALRAMPQLDVQKWNRPSF